MRCLHDPQVLHINVTDFMAAVEEVRDPSLRGRPFVVGWEGADRAIVLAVSRAAFQEGVRRGMLLGVARKWVKSLRTLPPDYDVYRRSDERLAEIARRFSPLVEVRGGGHLYIDLTGTQRLFGPPADCAARVRQEIIDGTDLVPALGLASGKVVSKVGTRVARPWGFVTVPPGHEQSFLAPQDVALLPGVGPKLLTRLRLLRIETIGDLASLSPEEATVLGPYGVLLRDRARGIDPSPVQGGEPAQRIVSAVHSFAEDANDPLVLERALTVLIRDLGYEIRAEGFAAGGVRLHVLYTDGRRTQGIRRFPSPLCYDAELLPPARGLLRSLITRRVRVRSLRCELVDLSPDDRQLDLFLPPELRRNRSFQQSLDRIRKRFGRQGILPCVALSTGS